MPAPSPTIHVMDDAPLVQRSRHRLLRSRGCAVATDASAEDFRAVEAASPGDLRGAVVLPGMDGLALHEARATAGVSFPRICITAYEHEAGRARALAAGAWAVLPTPVDAELLIEVWQRLRP